MPRAMCSWCYALSQLSDDEVFDDHGVGQLKGSQTMAQQCYMAWLQAKVQFKPFPMELDTIDGVSMEWGEPSSKLLKIPLLKRDPIRTTWISSNMDKVMKEKLIAFL